MEIYSKGNYAGARVRFTIAQRKADREHNYSGKQQSVDYTDRSAECAQLIKDGDRNFNLSEFEIAKKYYDRISELNPKDPNNLERTLKCRNETDYLDAKKQADAFFLNNDWSQASVMYNVCLDSSKMHLNSYKRYESEVRKRSQECTKQLNMFNPDSLKLKLKILKDKFKKKPKTEEQKPEEKAPPAHGLLPLKVWMEPSTCLRREEAEGIVTEHRKNNLNPWKRAWKK